MADRIGRTAETILSMSISGLCSVIVGFTFDHVFHFIPYAISPASGLFLNLYMLITPMRGPKLRKEKKIDWRIGLILGGGALLGAQIGSHVAIFISDRPLEIVFTSMALLMAWQSFKRARHGLNLKHRSFPHPYILGFIISLPIGIMTGTLGTSGGIMFIAVMMLGLFILAVFLVLLTYFVSEKGIRE